MILLLMMTTFLMAAEQDACQLMKQMITRSKTIRTLEFTMKTRERMNGEMIEREGYFRIERQPRFRVYYERGFPDKGAKVLYDASADSIKMTVKPNTFPWVPISLGKDDWMVRKGGHHTVDQAGFDYTLDILDFIMKKYGAESCGFIRFGTQGELDGTRCQNVELDNPHFTWINYTLKDGETVESIAKERRISDYMILQRNPQYNKYSDIYPGTVIRIPVDYAKRMTVCVDEQTGLPALIRIYDDQGLYEEYQFLNMKVNPPFTDADFVLD